MAIILPYLLYIMAKKAKKTSSIYGVLVIALLGIVGCCLLAWYSFFYSGNTQNMENVVETWDVIVVDYVWKLTDGTVFDTSVESVAQESWVYNPNRDYTEGLKFTAGNGDMIKWFDQWVIWMTVWETKSVTIPPEEAYWEKDESLIIRIPIQDAGDVASATVGMKVYLEGGYPATVTEVTDTEIVIDANHELAGKTLVFDITVKEIEKAETEE